MESSKGPLPRCAQGAAGDRDLALAVCWVIDHLGAEGLRRVDAISVLSVPGVTEGNGSVEILSWWGYYCNQMLRFPTTLHGLSLLPYVNVEANYFRQGFVVQSQALSRAVLLKMPVKAALVEINLAGCVGEFAFC